jgi:hypothetical protein
MFFAFLHPHLTTNLLVVTTVTGCAGTEKRSQAGATDPAVHSSPVFFAGAESLGSGRRVQGREAIACDAEGALDAAAVTRTLIAEEDGC